MKCPKCKAEFPRGAKFCPSCGLEPLSRRFLIIVLIFVVVWAFIAIVEFIEKDWFIAVPAALTVVVWGYLFAARFQVTRAAKTDE